MNTMKWIRRRFALAGFILALAIIAPTPFAPGLAQLGAPGTPERLRYDRAFFETPHYLQVRMEYRHNGQDGQLEAVIRCNGRKEYPRVSPHAVPPPRLEQYWVKVPHREYVSHVLADGSAIFLSVPQVICYLWPEKWMLAEFANSLQPTDAYPPDFVPLLTWADRANDPNRVEMYVSRIGLASPTSAIAFRRIAFSVLDPSDKAKIDVQIIRELNATLPHPVPGHYALPSRTGWKSWKRNLLAVPEGLWSRYPSLVALIERHGNESAPVEIPRATIPRDVIPEIYALFNSWSGYDLDRGLPGPDGKSGVIGYTTFARPRTSFLPDRCILPRDWDIPIDCNESTGCKALLDRRGTRLFFRAGDQPLALPSVDIGGQPMFKGPSGFDTLVYIPELRMLVLPN